MQERRSNIDRTAQTRLALLAAARKLMAEQGFAETNTPDIVAQAGVTRGALYHHFADKTDLFRAVVTQESAAVAEAIEQATAGIKNPREALKTGANAYLEAMAEPGRTRLLLIEAPAVLGPALADAIDAATARRTLAEGLAAAGGRSDDILVDLVSAAFDRAALRVSEGADPASCLAAITRLLDGIVGD
jgi:AcrR family transcriptional regulator